MLTPLKGTVHGRTVELDDAIGGREGRRVLVLIEDIEESSMPASESAAAWHGWVQAGPQGPIQDDEPPSFPS